MRAAAAKSALETGARWRQRWGRGAKGTKKAAGGDGHVEAVPEVEGKSAKIDSEKGGVKVRETLTAGRRALDAADENPGNTTMAPTCAREGIRRGSKKERERPSPLSE